MVLFKLKPLATDWIALLATLTSHGLFGVSDLAGLIGGTHGMLVAKFEHSLWKVNLQAKHFVSVNSKSLRCFTCALEALNQKTAQRPIAKSTKCVCFMDACHFEVMTFASFYRVLFGGRSFSWDTKTNKVLNFLKTPYLCSLVISSSLNGSSFPVNRAFRCLRALLKPMPLNFSLLVGV